MKKNQSFTFQMIIVLIGIALRFLNAQKPQLWRDEAFSVRAAQFSIQRMFKVVMKDTAPPLHYLLLKGWISIFGNSQFSVRLPSILAGCASIIIYWKLTHKCLQQIPVARLIALGFYIANYHILNYDQMARVYSIVMMLTLGLLYCLLEIIQKSDTNWTYFVMSFLTALGLWSYNIFPLVGFVNLCFYFVYGNKQQRIKTFIAYFIAGLIYLPIFINFTIKQFGVVTQTHLPFYPIVSLFIIFTPMFAGEREPSSNSTIDGVIRISAFVVFTFFFLATGADCLKSLKLKSERVKVLWYWLLAVLLLVYIYSLKSIITSPRYLIFFAPIISIIVGDLYRNKPKKIAILIVFSLFLCVYETNIGYQYKGDNRSILENINYDSNTLLLCLDGASYHSAKFYSKYPISIYDPQRQLPYYHGTAIFQQQDYFHGNLKDYNRIYTLMFKEEYDIARELVEYGFKKEKRRNWKSMDYKTDVWNKVKEIK